MGRWLAGLAGAMIGLAAISLILWLIIWSKGVFALVLGVLPAAAIGWGIGSDLWERRQQ